MVGLRSLLCLLVSANSGNNSRPFLSDECPIPGAESCRLHRLGSALGRKARFAIHHPQRGLRLRRNDKSAIRFAPSPSRTPSSIIVLCRDRLRRPAEARCGDGPQVPPHERAVVSVAPPVVGRGARIAAVWSDVPAGFQTEKTTNAEGFLLTRCRGNFARSSGLSTTAKGRPRR